MNKTEKQVIESIDQLADDILDFTCRLVAEPSILQNEASVLEVMEAELKKLSLDPVRLPIDPVQLSRHPGPDTLSCRSARSSTMRKSFPLPHYPTRFPTGSSNSRRRCRP